MELEQESPSLDEPLESQPTGKRYEQDAHSNTSQRLSWYEMTEMELAQERVVSFQGREFRYQSVDPLDDSFIGWLQQRLRGRPSPRSVINTTDLQGSTWIRRML